MKVLRADTPSSRPPYQSAARQLNLWELVVWTYSAQKAHLYLAKPFDWFVWALADLEFRLDDMPRKAVHADAHDVHKTVCALGQDAAEAITFFAAQAQQPEPPNVLPTPHPVRVDRGTPLAANSRCGHEKVNGARSYYLIRWTETHVVTEPVFKKIGKNRFRQTGSQTVRVPNEFCPIDWQPDLVWLIALAGIYDQWRRSMFRLGEVLAGHGFRDHTLKGLGFDAGPPPLDTRMLIEARKHQIEGAYGPAPVDVDLAAHDAAHSVTDQDGAMSVVAYSRWARVTRR